MVLRTGVLRKFGSCPQEESPDGESADGPLVHCQFIFYNLRAFHYEADVLQ